MSARIEHDGGEPSAGQPNTSWGAHVRSTVRLAIPLIAASLGQMAINITDTVMVGQLGARQLAAVVLATQAFTLTFVFGVGFAQAIMPMAAHAEGQGDTAGVRRSVRMGLWVLLGYAAAVMVPLWHLEGILRALGQKPELAALAGDYMRLAQWGMVPALFVMGLRSHLAVVDKAHVLMWVTFFAVPVNAALNYVLIFGHLGAPALGVVGAALASIGTKFFTAAGLFAYTNVSSAIRRVSLYADFTRPEWPAFWEVVRLGWPIGLTILAEVSLFMGTSILVGWLGTVPLAAHGIAIQVTSVAFMVPLGFSSAATVRVGVARGREDRVAAWRAGGSALLLAIGFGLLAGLAFWLFPVPLVRLYLDASDPQAARVIAAAVPMFYVAAAFQIVDGIQAVAAGNLRGLKDTRVPMIIAIISYWIIGMPAAYVLGFPAGLEAVGVWMGLAAGLLLAAVFLTRRFWRGVSGG